MSFCRLQEVDICQVQSNDVVRVDKSKDLIGLIDKHTSYKIQVDDDGRHHQTTYNIEALEKQVIATECELCHSKKYIYYEFMWSPYMA